MFHRRTVELKTDLAKRQKKMKPPDVQKLALVPPLVRLVPPLAHVDFTDLFLFATLPIFYLERSFLHQNQA